MITYPYMVKCTCPYCDTVNSVPPSNFTYGELAVVHYYPEDGGCDQSFVVRPTVNLVIDIFKLEKA